MKIINGYFKECYADISVFLLCIRIKIRNANHTGSEISIIFQTFCFDGILLKFKKVSFIKELLV